MDLVKPGSAADGGTKSANIIILLEGVQKLRRNLAASSSCPSTPSIHEKKRPKSALLLTGGSKSIADMATGSLSRLTTCSAQAERDRKSPQFTNEFGLKIAVAATRGPL